MKYMKYMQTYYRYMQVYSLRLFRKAIYMSSYFKLHISQIVCRYTACMNYVIIKSQIILKNGHDIVFLCIPVYSINLKHPDFLPLLTAAAIVCPLAEEAIPCIYIPVPEGAFGDDCNQVAPLSWE